MALSRAALNAHKATYKKDTVLLGDTQRHVQRKPTDVQLGRDIHHVHPSEMAKRDWCHRHTYYRCVDTPIETKPESFTFRMLNAFENGHNAHHKYQQWWQEMGILWGVWKCRHCSRTRFGKAQLFCQHTGCSGTEEYHEVPFKDDKYHTWGHADALLLLGDEFMLGEIKTIGEGTVRFEAPNLFEAMQKGLKTTAEVWKAITRPFPSHLLQGQFYLHLMRMCYPTMQDVHSIVFIYEWKWTNETKEFVVRYAPEISQPYFDRALEVAVGVRSGGEIMPTRPDWADIDSGFCKACDYYKTCYSIETTAAPVEQPRRKISVQKTTATKRKKALG